MGLPSLRSDLHMLQHIAASTADMTTHRTIILSFAYRSAGWKTNTGRLAATAACIACKASRAAWCLACRCLMIDRASYCAGYHAVILATLT